MEPRSLSNSDPSKIIHRDIRETMNLREIRIDNEKINKRNKRSFMKLCEYKTSYRSTYRFLVGSWLLNEKELKHPFHKKSVILIQSNNKIVDVDSVGDIEIVLANSLKDVVESYYFRFGIEEMVIYHGEQLYEVCEYIAFPKYSATLTKPQRKIQEENIRNFSIIKENRGEGSRR
nr:TPA_asm: 22 kDa protein [Agrostis ophiovirus_agro]